MAEERFWNTDETISTAKFTVHNGAMTMRELQKKLTILFELEQEKIRYGS